LLLRLTAAGWLIGLAGPDIPSAIVQPGALARDAIAIAGALLLLLGLWTPVAAAVTAIDQLWIAFFIPKARPEQWIYTSLALLAAAVAMLGPGAWSIDARLFGRKRFELRRDSRQRKLSP